MASPRGGRRVCLPRSAMTEVAHAGKTAGVGVLHCIAIAGPVAGGRYGSGRAGRAGRANGRRSPPCSTPPAPAAGGALVVRGVAGSGKSTLLADAAGRRRRTCGCCAPPGWSRSRRWRSPRCSGCCGRCAAGSTRLPAPQAAALRAALGEADGEGDRFLAFLGTLSLLADAAEQPPVLAVVDDAHWLDDASAAALLFAARRLQDERVALLFAARDGDARRFDAPDLPDRRPRRRDRGRRRRAAAPRGPTPPSTRRCATSWWPPPAATRWRWSSWPGCSPPTSWPGGRRCRAPLPLTGGVERAFLDRYRRLSEAAQRFLLVAAADDTARLTVVRDAADRLGAGDAALDEVERAGLLRVDGDTCRPLPPAGALGGLPGRDQRAAPRRAPGARRRAAPATPTGGPGTWPPPPTGPTRRSSPPSTASPSGPRPRGGHEAAAAAWARAAELTAGGEDRGRRLYLAASSAWLGAHPSRAAALAQAAAADVTDPLLRARLLTLQGQIEWNTRSLNDGYDLILQAAQVAAGADDGDGRSSWRCCAASLSAFGARSPRAVRPGRAGRRSRRRTPRRGAGGARRCCTGSSPSAARDWAAAGDVVPARVRPDRRRPARRPRAAAQPRHRRVADRRRRARPAAARAAADRRPPRRGAQHGRARPHPRLLRPRSRPAPGRRPPPPPRRRCRWPPSTGHPGLTALPTAELALVAALRGDDAADRHLAEADRDPRARTRSASPTASSST